MEKNRQIKIINEKIEKFIDFRKTMSADEKKIEAGLLIEEIESIDVDSAYHKVTGRFESRTRNTQIITLITRIAAIFTLPLLAFALWSLFVHPKYQNPIGNEITWQEIQSPAGMRSHVVLPDGSDLWLNAESKIKYSIPFIRNNRQIELKGEAYFQVTKNKKVPFEVKAGNATVKVLGTCFNVKAYADDKQLEVALTKGSVEFRGTAADGKKAVATLIPNDYLTMNKNTGEVQLKNTNLDEYISWRQNIMMFDETPMAEVAKTLERWYGVKVIIADNEIYKNSFTTTFENESLFRVLELLELSSPTISIKYTPGKFNKKSNTVSPSVVTITKK